MNWREPETYRYTKTLDARQWGWEFMRRNPVYQQDYAWFIDTWNTLEQHYGRPPQRDYQRWKQDPLVWRRSLPDSDSDSKNDACIAEGERL